MLMKLERADIKESAADHEILFGQPETWEKQKILKLESLSF